MATIDEVRAASKDYFGGDELAADIFATKYALVDRDGDYKETTPDQMHRRLAKEFARIEQKYVDPLSEEEIFKLFDHFRYVVPQGSPMSGVGNDFQIQSVSNCFVIPSPEDSYGGILKTDQELVQIAKRRGGVGLDISPLRPKGMVTSNCAKTTDGVGVFMQRFSNSCREVAQNGRRGALMITLSCHHPEIMSFIGIKRDRSKVTGANISVRWSDEFLSAAFNNEKVQLRWPVDEKENPQLSMWVDARPIWDAFIEAAHDCAEPGALFWDRVLEMSPSECYADVGFGTVSTNPCVTGDTLIATADGRNAVTIRQLAAEKADVPVYATDPETGRVEIKMGRTPRKTKSNVDVWRLTLDDGSYLDATPDHRILTKEYGYIELQSLEPGMSIMPFNSFDSNGYRQICNAGADMIGGAKRNRRQYRLIHDFYHGQIDAKTYAIHHRDFSSKNDRIENLEMMLHEDHQRLHADLMKGEKNPYHRMSDEWKFNFASHPGETNGRYSGFTNSQLIEEGRKIFDKYGKLTCKLWAEHAKSIGAPQFFSKFRFGGKWTNFKSAVISNHKVVSVEFIGKQDVYNITVDDHHNYCVITSAQDDEFIVSSGICVKNCGEIVLSPYDSCRLMVLNVKSYVRNPFTPDAVFDEALFASHVIKAQRLMDDLIDIEIEQVEKILRKVDSDPETDGVKETERRLWENVRDRALRGRRTGLGVTAIGDAVACMGLRYGSDESIEFVESVYKQLAVNAYMSSTILAEERGAFPEYDAEKEKGHPFVDRILAADEVLKQRMERFGRRNIALLTTAPAGSVSCETQTTSGIENAYLLELERFRKLTAEDNDTPPDRVDDSGDKWQKYIVRHKGLQEWMDITGETDITKSPYHGATVDDVDWVQKVKMQAAAQKWICHSISNTTNVPKDASVELIHEIYKAGWESGCKGVTVYREGSRDPVLKRVGEEAASDDTLVSHKAPKRPKELPCHIKFTRVKEDNWVILIGLMNGRPYEVMGGKTELVEIPKSCTEGVLIKNSRKTVPSRYDLKLGENGHSVYLKNIVKLFDNPEHSAFTRVISLALRHGADIKYVVEQLMKDRDSDMFSFAKSISRALKAYIKDGEEATDKTCDSCGAEALVYMEGCLSCSACGASRCG